MKRLGLMLGFNFNLPDMLHFRYKVFSLFEYLQCDQFFAHLIAVGLKRHLVLVTSTHYCWSITHLFCL